MSESREKKAKKPAPKRSQSPGSSAATKGEVALDVAVPPNVKAELDRVHQKTGRAKKVIVRRALEWYLPMLDQHEDALKEREQTPPSAAFRKVGESLSTLWVAASHTKNPVYTFLRLGELMRACILHLRGVSRDASVVPALPPEELLLEFLSRTEEKLFVSGTQKLLKVVELEDPEE